ncbi:sulfatase-like protein [Murinocardiopsis flavida]|uniref:Sulfatase-like protein n=1 Tax=Murinocardiopsis flavida TaxID=645275 RepID=A0A2P8CLW4_9ACTN|nr:sulfatase-like hydrolase/transferase [Murinocardiopsis flavida]PSK85952.1 sulfatase-like protein [Murinocardiopsis flavida]
MPAADLAERDVVLVTLDSCRYDVATRASLPHLSALGPLLEAETPGTYTFPAHSALFNGFLPQPVNAGFVLGHHRLGAVWRSGAARPATRPAGVQFTGTTLMEHYADRGYRVIGAGGVTFFNPGEPGNSLPRLFPEFHYVGRPAQQPLTRAGRVVDRDEALTLAHAGFLAQRCLEADRFFLFINCPSTHIPYTTPNSPLTPSTGEALERLYRLHDTKSAHPPLAPDAVEELLGMQRRGLEWADEQLGLLFRRLAHRQPLVVVCADHGEEFGEGGRYGHGHPHPTVTTVPLWCGLLSP